MKTLRTILLAAFCYFVAAPIVLLILMGIVFAARTAIYLLLGV